MKIEINIPIRKILELIIVLIIASVIIGSAIFGVIKLYDYEENWHGADWDLCDSIEDKEGIAYITCLDTYRIRGEDADNRAQHVRRVAIKHTIMNTIGILIVAIIIIAVIYVIVEDYL